MRKLLFAVVLVSASFGGGMLVNGPGLRWVQTTVLGMLKGAGGGDEKSPEELAMPTVGEAVESDPIPSAPLPPLGGPAKGATTNKEADDPARAGVVIVPAKSPNENPAVAGSPATVSAPRAPEPSETRGGAQARRAGGAPDPNSQIILAKADVPERPLALEAPNPLQPPPRETEKESDPKFGDSPWGDAPDSAPAAAVPPRPHRPNGPGRAEPAVAAAAAPASAESMGGGTSEAAPGDWAALRQRMKVLGVSRYGIEGEPGGRVRFHCLIPLAGRRAVAQQFEAEGDDEWQAIDAALRRVALWRATEGP